MITYPLLWGGGMSESALCHWPTKTVIDVASPLIFVGLIYSLAHVFLCKASRVLLLMRSDYDDVISIVDQYDDVLRKRQNDQRSFDLY